MQKSQNKDSYTKLSLIWDFLKGSRMFFLISILAALFVNGLEMISPQIIRVTIDSVIGDKELDLPLFAVSLVERAGGIKTLKSHLWLIAFTIVMLATGSAVFRYVNMYYNSRGVYGLRFCFLLYEIGRAHV